MKSKILILLLAVIAMAGQAQQTAVPLVYDVENTGSGFAPATMPDYDQLPVIRELPDALEGVSRMSRRRMLRILTRSTITGFLRVSVNTSAVTMPIACRMTSMSCVRWCVRVPCCC